MAALATGSVCAQPFSFGVIGGIPLAPLLDANPPDHTGTTNRYTVGPTFEIHLWRGLQFEFDALYKRMNYAFRDETSIRSTEVSRWEFPLLLKYRFRRRGVLPFVDLGVALNRITGDPPMELRHRQALGFAAGGGIELRLSKFRLSPGIRYIHWGERNFGTRDSPLRSNLDQVDFLLAFTL